MMRVQIIGGSGAGKSTLARQLARRHALPVVELDDLFWEPGWVDVGHAELARRLAPRVAGDAWVVAGNYGPTTEPLLWPRLTHLLVLDLPYPLMMRRTVWRTVRRGLTGTPCCNGNRESVWRLFRRDGVVRYLARTWDKRHARFATLADEPALAHVRVHLLRRPAEVARLAAHGLDPLT
jgi:adenylate kinase family enzyme